MSGSKTEVEQLLDEHQIAYQPVTMEVEKTADTLVINQGQIKPEEVFKTLAMTGKKTGPVVAVVPLLSRMSYKKLAAVSDNPRIGMIPAERLQATTGYVHGANNPVGIWHHKGFPIYFAEQAQRLGTIYVSSGELGHSVRVNAQQLAALVNGQFADLTEA